MRADPQSEKMTDALTLFFALSGSGHVKAAGKTLVKSTPNVRLGIKTFVENKMILNRT